MTIWTLLFAASFLPYFWLNKRPAKYYWKSKFDDQIPLIKIFVFPYFSLLPLIITCLVFLDGGDLTRFLVAYLIANLLASLFWYFVPNGVKRPKIETNNFLGKLLNTVYSNDHDTNGFPSGHVYGACICTYFLAGNLTGNAILYGAVIL